MAVLAFHPLLACSKEPHSHYLKSITPASIDKGERVQLAISGGIGDRKVWGKIDLLQNPWGALKVLDKIIGFGAARAEDS